MLQLTESLRAELRRLTLEGEADTGDIRLTRDAHGALRLERDLARADDQVLLAESEYPRLVASTMLASQLDGAILHCRSKDETQYGAPGLVLLQPRAGSPRPQWQPPQSARSSRRLAWLSPTFLSRRTAAPASTTQSASL